MLGLHWRPQEPRICPYTFNHLFFQCCSSSIIIYIYIYLYIYIYNFIPPELITSLFPPYMISNAVLYRSLSTVAFQHFSSLLRVLGLAVMFSKTTARDGINSVFSHFFFYGKFNTNEISLKS